MGDDQETFERFQGAAQVAFAKKFTKLVRGLKPNAALFYNAQNEANIDPGVGPRARIDEMTHCEIESLPSGFWGYYHFPRMARQQSHWSKFWLGMIGRFQKMWATSAASNRKPRLSLSASARRRSAAATPSATSSPARHAQPGGL